MYNRIICFNDDHMLDKCLYVLDMLSSVYKDVTKDSQECYIT